MATTTPRSSVRRPPHKPSTTCQKGAAPSAPSRAAALTQPDPLNASSLLALQRVAGNTAVTALIRKSAGRRSGPMPDQALLPATPPDLALSNRPVLNVVQRQPKTADRKKEAEKLRPHLGALQAIAGSAAGRHKAVMDYGTEGTGKVDQIAGNFDYLAKMYKLAYDRYAAKMKEAGQDAALADSVRDAVIGVAIGVAVGLAMPEVAAATGAVLILKQVASEAKGELLELGIGKGIGLGTDTLKANFDPNSGLTPEVQQLAQAKILVEMYRNIAVATSGAGLFFDTASAAKDLVADIKGFSSGETDKTAAKIEAEITALTDFDGKGKDAGDKVTKAKALIVRKAAEAATDAGEASMMDMEKQIWVRHLADLSPRETEKLLDNNTIQAYLFQIGVIGPSSQLDTTMEQWGGWVPFLNDLDPSVSKRANQMAFDERAAMDMVGKEGTASTDIEGSGGDGLANVENRPWSAFAGRGQSIKRGEPVRVIRTQLFGELLSKKVALTVVRIEG